MKALVVGAGWFGCEVASTLEKLGIDFDILDKSDSFFSGSSSKNQNRLHYGGFHYCRSYKTRAECRQGYNDFMKIYPDFSEDIDSFYIVAAKSILDYRSYIAIFEHEGSKYETKTIEDLRGRGIDFNDSFVDGDKILLVKERWINFEKVKEYFSTKFGHKLLDYHHDRLHISEDRERIYYDEKVYDLAFDCSYGTLYPLEHSIFEPCLTLVYRRIDDNDEMSPAITIVDGQFFSVYPYKRSKSLYTMTHVLHTPLFQSNSIVEAKAFIENVNDTLVEERRNLIEEDVSKSYVNFLNTHEYVEHFTSMKTKFVDIGCADRSVRYHEKGHVLSLTGGKISGSLELGIAVTTFIHKHS